MSEIELPPGMSPEDVLRILGKAAKRAEPAGDDCVEFAKIDYGNGDELHVYRDIYKGKEMYSIRRFYTDKDDKTLKPGKGVTFHDEDIDEIIIGLEKMQEWLGEHASGSPASLGGD